MLLLLVLIITLAQVNFNDNICMAFFHILCQRNGDNFFVHDSIRFVWLQIHFLYFSVGWIMFAFDRVNDLIFKNSCLKLFPDVLHWIL